MNNEEFEHIESVLPDGISDEIRKAGIWLKDQVGVLEWAWLYKEAKIILKQLYENENVILGGEVLIVDGNDLRYTYDNWYYNTDSEMSWKENVEAGYSKALNYLDFYHNKCGEGYLYVIGFRRPLINFKSKS